MSAQWIDELITLFDATLRDVGQTRGIDFTAANKQFIAKALEDFGIDHIEGGCPGGNPTDDMFFSKDQKLKKAKIVAFGMTRRGGGRSVENDPGLNAFLGAKTDRTCLVDKMWDFHVTTALNMELGKNLRMNSQSIASAC